QSALIEKPLEEKIGNATSSPKTRLKNTIFKEPPRVLNAHPMIKIMEDSKNPPEDGDLIEGSVIEIDKSALFVDLGVRGTGIIFGKEFSNASDIIKKINVGDSVTAKIILRENEDGYVELSLKEARQALIWNEAEDAIIKKALFEIDVKEANKGGLILEWRGIVGFLPASQLKAEHYPRVLDGDKEKILQELQKLVGQKLTVIILTASAKEGKLIFSEKGPEQKEKEEIVEKYQVGNIIEGEITGIVDFGLFIKIEDGLEGLVHISEMDWGLVENPRTLFKVGQAVKAQIIEIKDNKISLSVKVLKENPWIAAATKYKKDDLVEGVVIKHNKHGALVSIEEGVAGLNHISEFGTEKVLKETLELGKKYSFKIILFEPTTQRMTLSRKEAQESEKKVV
ncbi:MAG: S1 RNA-binding domain-containing protein, partial [bacterium]|nr:S1 RNA-binding domain-containing protein [bacterium]